MTNRRRRTAGLIAVVLGIFMVAISVPLTALEHDGWPWHASITTTTEAGATVSSAEVSDTDGTSYRFTGTPAATATWLATTQEHLKQTHGIDDRILAGKILRVAGPALLLVGVAFLLPIGRRRRLAGVSLA